MEEKTYNAFNYAIKNNDIKLIQDLYSKNKEDSYIKLECAKMLIKCGKKYEGKTLLEELLSTSSRDLALLELGRLEVHEGDRNLARLYFDKLKFSSNVKFKQYALLELGKLEVYECNFPFARMHFQNALNTISKGKKEKYYDLIILCFIEEGNTKAALQKIREMVSQKLKVDSELLDYLRKLNVKIKDYPKSFKRKYFVNSIKNYDREVALKHIIDSHVKPKPFKSRFNPKINIYELFEDIKSMLTEENRLPRLELNDTYIVPYKSAGDSGQNFIRVITLPKTKDIISMYPVYDEFDTGYIQSKRNCKCNK